jgi:hypothetical protein
MRSLSNFVKACVFCAFAVVVGTPLLILVGGWPAEVARAAWASGLALDALLVLAIFAIFGAEATRQ